MFSRTIYYNIFLRKCFSGKNFFLQIHLWNIMSEECNSVFEMIYDSKHENGLSDIWSIRYLSARIYLQLRCVLKGQNRYCITLWEFLLWYLFINDQIILHDVFHFKTITLYDVVQGYNFWLFLSKIRINVFRY